MKSYFNHDLSYRYKIIWSEKGKNLPIIYYHGYKKKVSFMESNNTKGPCLGRAALFKTQ